MIKLACAIVGGPAYFFSVKVNESDLVDDLKDAIKAKIANILIDVDAAALQLFLGKTADGEWLRYEDPGVLELEEGRIHPDVQTLIDGYKLKAFWTIKDVLEENRMPTPQSSQLHVLIVVPEDAINRKRKRMEDEDEGAPDTWRKAIKEVQVPVLPLTCEALKEHLQRALDVKIPINTRLTWITKSKNTSGELSSILEKLFEPQPRGLSDITGGVLWRVIDPVRSGSESTSEGSYHCLWDTVIAELLSLVTDGWYRRNMNLSASTGLFRPDLCFYMGKNVCVLRGEEKASGFTLDVPVKELHEKLTWRYDDAPYVFGYAAVGLCVCLVAIRRDEKKQKRMGWGAKAEVIETYHLGDLKGRLSFFLAVLNLSTLFRPVVNLIQPLAIPDYAIITRSNGVKIEFAEDCVVKTYPPSVSSKIVNHLKNLHLQMKEHSVPNVVQLKRTNKSKKKVTLVPIGRLAPPENTQQLLMALRDILKALVALHAINLMHRDLRWENVLKYLDEGDKWFLIDFDDGTTSPAPKVTHLKVESHAPEILSSSSHTVKVDIWSVGYLLKTSPFQDLPPELESIKSQCLQKNPSSRPTAKSLLTDIESLIEKFLVYM